MGLSAPLLVTCCYLLLLTQRGFCSTNCVEVQNYTVSSSGKNSQECYARNSQTPCQSIDYLLKGVQNTSCMNVVVSSSMDLMTGLEVPSSTNELTIVGNKTSQSLISIRCHNKGGGIVFVNSSNIHLENLHFVGCGTMNMNRPYPKPDIPSLVDHAAIYFYHGRDIEVRGCTFSNSTGTGVIMNDVIGSNMLKDTNFTGNKPLTDSNSTNSTFGGLIIRRKCILGKANFTLESCFFTENENLQGREDSEEVAGGGLTFSLGALNSTSHVVISNGHFIGNRATRGAGIHINQSGTDSTISVDISGSTFVRNSASLQGGGISLTQDKATVIQCTLNLETSTFSNNSAKWGGGLAVYAEDNTGNITVRANGTVWCENTAELGGLGAGFSVKYKNIKRYSNQTESAIVAYFHLCHFGSNVINQNLGSVGTVYLQGSKAEFESTTFCNNTGSALSVLDSAYAAFSGNTFFVSNHGTYGAAIHVDENSVLALRSGVFLNFHNNSATVSGGAIYTKFYKDPDGVCVFESLNSLLHSSETFNVTFSFNTVGSDQIQSIFVGKVDNCLSKLANGSQDVLLFHDKIFTYDPLVHNQIGSYAVQFDLTTKTGDHVEIMLGEYFFLIPNMTDVFGNDASISEGNLVLRGVPHNESVKLVGPSSMSMDDYTQNNRLFISGSRSIAGLDKLVLDFIFENKTSGIHHGYREIGIKIVDCKPGFMYNTSEQICKCMEENNVLVCPSPSRSHACIRYGYWYGNHNQTDGKVLSCPGSNCQYSDGKCPQGQCPDAGSPGFCLLSDADDLCWNGLGGLLCSECHQNYSFTFDALRCVPSDTCTPGNTAVFIVALVVYWILILILLLFILSLDLSMGSGFMYGIVYYFSIVKVFTDDIITDVFLQTIINTGMAVTQLSPRAFGDFNICFVETWNLNLHHALFHFITPISVISIMIVIMWIARYCQLPRQISLAQNSPIHAICMLVLFSYTAVAYTCFTILRPTKIKGEWRVFLDPKIGYFDKEHLPFALIAIFLELFVLLPICLLLLFAPCLSGRVNLVKLRLKPILDDFQACYRPKCRWFAGFYFLARQLMFLAACLIPQELVRSNYYLHCTGIVILIVHSTFQPYKLKWLNMIDTVLLIDLLILSLFDLEWSRIALHRALPYALILIPTVYLYTMIALVILKRVFLSCRGTKVLQKYKARRLRATELPSAAAPTTTSVGFEDDEKAADAKGFGGSSFYKDYGEREPLLSENDSERLSHSNTGGRGEERQLFTTSSLRVAKSRPTAQSKKLSTA